LKNDCFISSDTDDKFLSYRRRNSTYSEIDDESTSEKILPQEEKTQK